MVLGRVFRTILSATCLRFTYVWSESSLSAWRKLGSLASHSEDSDQSGQMPRLFWVFAGRILTLSVLSCRGSYVNLHMCVKRATSKVALCPNELYRQGYFSAKVVVGHIYETSIKCLFFIQTQWNFVCMFFKAVRTTFNQFWGNLCFLKKDFILQTWDNFWQINSKNKGHNSYNKLWGNYS